MSEAWNNVARQFLEKRGFSCEPEPDWILRGEKKPDFFCRGPLDLWVEVKSLSEEEWGEHVNLISCYLRKHAEKVLGGGSVMAYVATGATELDAKAALNLAKNALVQPEAHSHKAVWIVIPEQPDYRRRLSFSISTRKGPIWLVSCKAEDGRYGYPFYLKPDPLEQTVEVVSDAEPTYQETLDSFAHQQHYRLALEITPDRGRFPIAISPSGPAKKLTNVQRIRKHISEANSQLKNGIRYREAPAVLFVFQEGALVPDDDVIFGALFDAMYDPSSDYCFAFGGKKGETCREPGKYAAWRSDQNRTVSALVYLRNFACGGLPCTIHNPYAGRPIPHGMFGGREWIPELGSDPLITFNLLEHPT